MSREVVVRQATAGDAAAVAELMTALNLAVGASGLPSELARLPEQATLTPDAAVRRLQVMAAVESVFLAERAGRPVGLMSLRVVPYLDQDAPYAELMNLYVRPEAQRGGVGRALVAEAERVAAARGATMLYIVTGADNLDAQAFYRSAGYVMPDVRFQRSLAPAEEAARA